jgi:hypothetical protein
MSKPRADTQVCGRVGQETGHWGLHQKGRMEGAWHSLCQDQHFETPTHSKPPCRREQPMELRQSEDLSSELSDCSNLQLTMSGPQTLMPSTAWFPYCLNFSSSLQLIPLSSMPVSHGGLPPDPVAKCPQDTWVLIIPWFQVSRVDQSQIISYPLKMGFDYSILRYGEQSNGFLVQC